MKYPKMFESMKIGCLTIKNMVVMGAMGHGQAADQCEFSKSTEDFYAARAKGGVGLILTGITEPDFEIEQFPAGGIAGYVNPNYNPKIFVERGTELTERVHSYGSKIFLQITAGFGRAMSNISCSENPVWADPSKKADALLIDVGNFDSMYHTYQPMYIPMGTNFRYTEELKKHVSIPVICTGRLHTPEVIEAGLEAGQADGVCIARALLADPDFVKKAELGRSERIRPCLSCDVGCLGRVLSGQRYCCAVNPAVNRETTYGLTPALRPKNVLVIGGGVAGMEAARVLAVRGHKACIWEKSAQLGGHLLSGGKPSFKEDEYRLVRWYELELKDLGVPVVFNREATAENVRQYDPDIIINATGSEAIIPRFVVGKEYTITGEEALLGTKPVGQRVVIVGAGLVGSELALHLMNQGKDVTLVEMLPEILSSGKPVPLMNRMLLSDMIYGSSIRVMTGSQLMEARKGEAVMKKNGEEVVIETDTTIIASGFRPAHNVADDLSSEYETYNIGDSRSIANIKNAVWDAYEVARSI